MSSSTIRMTDVFQSTRRRVGSLLGLTLPATVHSDGVQAERLAMERCDLDDAATTVLRLSGELDSRSYRQLLQQTRAIHAEGRSGLVLDLSGLATIGISGMFALHNAARTFGDLEALDADPGWQALCWGGEKRMAGGGQGRVRLVKPTPAVARVLSGSPLPIDRDVPAALAALRA